MLTAPHPELDTLKNSANIAQMKTKFTLESPRAPPSPQILYVSLVSNFVVTPGYPGMDPWRHRPPAEEWVISIASIHIHSI